MCIYKNTPTGDVAVLWTSSSYPSSGEILSHPLAHICNPVCRCSILPEDEFIWILEFIKLTYEFSSLKLRWTFRFYQSGNTSCLHLNWKIHNIEYIVYFIKPDLNNITVLWIPNAYKKKILMFSAHFEISYLSFKSGHIKKTPCTLYISASKNIQWAIFVYLKTDIFSKNTLNISSLFTQKLVKIYLVKNHQIYHFYSPKNMVKSEYENVFLSPKKYIEFFFGNRNFTQGLSGELLIQNQIWILIKLLR